MYVWATGATQPLQIEQNRFIHSEIEMIQRPRRESATRTTSISASGLRMRRSDDQHFRVSQLGGVRIGVPFGALRERSSPLALGLAQAGSHEHCQRGISLKISSERGSGP